LQNPDKVSNLVLSLPAGILTKRVGSRWSIQENVGHLIDLEELHDKRIDDFIAGLEKLGPADLNKKKQMKQIITAKILINYSCSLRA
jgi:hypothetical protein